jgi:hypothetical protein
MAYSSRAPGKDLPIRTFIGVECKLVECSWATGDDAGEPYVVGTTQCAGHVTEAKLKQLMPMLPLVYLKAVPVQPTWIPTSVGFLRQDP